MRPTTAAAAVKAEAQAVSPAGRRRPAAYGRAAGISRQQRGTQLHAGDWRKPAIRTIIPTAIGTAARQRRLHALDRRQCDAQRKSSHSDTSSDE